MVCVGLFVTGPGVNIKWRLRNRGAAGVAGGWAGAGPNIAEVGGAQDFWQTNGGRRMGEGVEAGEFVAREWRQRNGDFFSTLNFHSFAPIPLPVLGGGGMGMSWRRTRHCAAQSGKSGKSGRAGKFSPLILIPSRR